MKDRADQVAILVFEDMEAIEAEEYLHAGRRGLTASSLDDIKQTATLSIKQYCKGHQDFCQHLLRLPTGSRFRLIRQYLEFEAKRLLAKGQQATGRNESRAVDSRYSPLEIEEARRIIECTKLALDDHNRLALVAAIENQPLELRAVAKRWGVSEEEAQLRFLASISGIAAVLRKVLHKRSHRAAIAEFVQHVRIFQQSVGRESDRWGGARTGPRNRYDHG